MVAIMSSNTIVSGSCSPYLCYLLVSSSIINKDNGIITVPRRRRPQRTYVGITNNFQRRLRQHNGELVGGAKYTRIGRPWERLVTIEGFTCKQESMQFEWMWKHLKKKNSKGGTIATRFDKLYSLLQKEKWTERAPIATSIPLLITIYNTTTSQLLLEDNNGKSMLEILKEIPSHVDIKVISDIN